MDILLSLSSLRTEECLSFNIQKCFFIIEVIIFIMIILEYTLEYV